MERKVYVNEARTIFVEIWTLEPEAIRSQAVENVDARHGYTVEFSNTPGQHAAEYDEEERRLTAASEIVNVAQREAPDHTWGPPTRVTLEAS